MSEENTEKPKNPGGRPSKLDNIVLGQIKKLAEFGMTDKQLAEFFEVTEQTINNWKLENPQFLEALKQGKDICDSRVERSLFERACGFEHPSEEIFCNKEGLVTRVPTVKKYAPDTIASIFWLTNRKRDQWKDSKSIDHTSGGQPINFSVALPKEVKV